MITQVRLPEFSSLLLVFIQGINTDQVYSWTLDSQSKSSERKNTHFAIPKVFTTTITKHKKKKKKMHNF